MINSYTPIVSATRTASATNLVKNTATDQTTDLLASFKEIFSTMMMTSSLSSSDQSAETGLSDMMAPLMMLLLEQLVEKQMELATPASASASQPEPADRPVGGTLTQDFHPGHNGLDFGVVVGTPVQSTMDGQVAYAGWNDQGYGNLVVVENGAYKTYYAHLSSIPVAVADTVTAGSVIGLSGNTGYSTGPHLHYEIRKNNVPIDPTAVTLGASA